MTLLGTMLRSNSLLHASRIAIRDEAGNLRWDTYVHRIACTATALRASGVGAGERYAILARNSLVQAELVNAGYWSGAIAVPLNFRLAPAEIAVLLADAGCRALFVDAALAALLKDPALRDWAPI